MQTSLESKEGSTALQVGQDFKTARGSLLNHFVVPYLGCGTPSGNLEELVT